LDGPAGTSSSLDSSSNSSSTGGSSVPPGMREVRYWHEITRSHWHNRLGNLVLLQPSGHQVSSRSLMSQRPSRSRITGRRKLRCVLHSKQHSGGINTRESQVTLGRCDSSCQSRRQQTIIPTKLTSEPQ
jgi:hypothetical protein